MAPSTFKSNSMSRALTRRDMYSDFDPKTQTCALGFAEGVMAGNKLYVEGGSIWYRYNGTDREGPNMFLRVLDLSQPFTVTNASSIPLNTIERPSSVPETSGGDLWYYNSHLYLRHGYTEYADANWPGWNRWSNGTISDFWRYDIDANKWEIFQHNPKMKMSSGKEEFVPRLRHAISVTADKKAYVISGEDDEKGSMMNGMVIYDFMKKTWSHQSTPWKSWASGLAVHIPLGKGYLLGFSGRSRSDDTLSSIAIFDLSTQRWLSPQIATPAFPHLGFPAPRQKACAVVAQAKDGSSWNVYVYGGRDPSGFERTYNDVWVLSVPSFKWFLVNIDAGENNTGPQGLESMVCGIIGGDVDEEGGERRGSKMILYGGRHSPGNIGAECDPAGTHIFDLNTLRWEQNYDPTTTKVSRSVSSDSESNTYQVPEAIYDIIGGDSSGGATLIPESGGFSNQAMELDVKNLHQELGLDLNSSVTSTPTSTPSMSTSPEPVATGPTDTSTVKDQDEGQVVSLVFAGIIGISILAVVGVWLVTRKRRKEGGVGHSSYREKSVSDSRARWGGNEPKGKGRVQESHGFISPEASGQVEQMGSTSYLRQEEYYRSTPVGSETRDPQPRQPSPYEFHDQYQYHQQSQTQGHVQPYQPLSQVNPEQDMRQGGNNINNVDNRMWHQSQH